MTELTDLRSMAVRAALFPPASLAKAVSGLRFVQYDPIRCPARAQDLVLHQRVRAYRCGDLDRAYERLGLDEGYLHVYGAMTPGLRALVAPASDRTPSGFALDVLQLVRERRAVQAREVTAALGGHRATNAWGTQSSATTVALDQLHRHWLVRVVRRVNGAKVYGPADPVEVLPHIERVRRLTLHLARALRPVSVATLRGALVDLRRRGGVDATAGVDILLRSGELHRERVSGMDYLWPADDVLSGTVPDGVRLLAPFDPVVWDRRRFEHLWGWPFRFEAYTPASKRRLGYYSIPLLHADQVVGWVQCTVTDGRLSVTPSYARRCPTGTQHKSSLDLEVTRLAHMLGLPVGSVT